MWLFGWELFQMKTALIGQRVRKDILLELFMWWKHTDFCNQVIESISQQLECCRRLAIGDEIERSAEREHADSFSQGRSWIATMLSAVILPSDASGEESLELTPMCKNECIIPPMLLPIEP
jgi:hypothetical protein